jgi:hypothetical protein
MPTIPKGHVDRISFDVIRKQILKYQPKGKKKFAKTRETMGGCNIRQPE